MRKRTLSIRTRLSANVLMVLLFVFGVVWIGFNLVVSGYIEARALRQLDEARAHIDQDVPMRMNPPDEPVEFSGTMRRISGAARRAIFVAPVQTMVATEDYQMLFPDPAGEAADAADPDMQERLAVLTVLRENSVDLANGGMQRVSVPSALYYIIAMPFQQEMALQRDESVTGDPAMSTTNAKLVLYTNMTDVAALSATINHVLLMIIAVTAAFSGGVVLLLSARLTRPIRALSAFADALGHSDFTRRHISMHDRELTELLGAMNRAAAQLDAYDKEQKAFFQNVSHELRTPLMSIKGYAEGVGMGVFEDNAQAADVIAQEADHLTALVEDLLYVSRADSIAPGFQTSPCDMRELLSNCTQALRSIALKQHKRIEVDFDQEPMMVNCDERNLFRALSNILTNGLRYATETVTVRCFHQGHEVHAVIRNDGPGIDEADLPRIFDRFYYGKGGKHGIGLAIAKAVVGQHGGKMKAYNADHGGAEFVVMIPAMR